MNPNQPKIALKIVIAPKKTLFPAAVSNTNRFVSK